MYYPMKQPYGFALIINIKSFDGRTDKDVELDERTGSDVDVKKLQDLWDQLGFEVRTHVDLKAHEIYGVVRKMANADALQNSSCFVCCIMTHGDMGVVYGSDSKSLDIKDIIDLFKQDNCSALTEKPKLFFIQACRGCQGSPPGMPEIKPTPELDASALSEADGDVDCDHINDSTFSRSADPSEAHFLIGYSTVPDHASFRNVKIGTWYIDALVEIFSHYHKDE
ncbi:caspase 8, partial [Paramuricea clavata]